MRILILLTLLGFLSCSSQAQKEMSKSGKNNSYPEDQRIVKSEADWKSELSDEEYYVIREKGTERAFTGGELLTNKKEGTYTCKACGLHLFTSATKFKSGTGWPSFYKPVEDSHIAEDVDYKIGYKRVEVLCARCDGHLGHVFEDGPEPTGLRYCINAVSLNFVEPKK